MNPASSAVRFGTKAETLSRLAERLTAARVLPQTRFTTREWSDDRASVLAAIGTLGSGPLIVRSSALVEDAADGSLAGHFRSVLDVSGTSALTEAIDRVTASYERSASDDQVLVQPMLAGVTLSGVAFSREPGSGAPYFVISYDAHGVTDAVTSGRSSDVRTCYVHRTVTPDEQSPIRPVVTLMRELEALLACDAIDVEFAVCGDSGLYLLQARRLTARHDLERDDERHAAALRLIEQDLSNGIRRHPYLYGARTVYGIMPDWNPAEMIGLRPRPLALSLYKEILTDNIWAYQRNNYGYQNLRSFPLLVGFAGLPYIDVRVSFNSFVPADVEPELSERLVTYYINRLIESPSHHDKVEFEIIQSCYTLDLPDRLAPLKAHGFNNADCDRLAGCLRRLTNTIIHGETGLWRKDIEKIGELERRREVILGSSLSTPAKVYWLLEDCKRYGTLPFAGLARAGFIAVQMLKSLVSTGILSPDDYQRFMNSLQTVGSGLAKDFADLDRDAFLAKYGHLRPGTYDILSPRYDEQPERYFSWTSKREQPAQAPPFSLSLSQLNETSRALMQHGINHDGVGLFNFIKAAIEGREYSKFAFTRSLSDALRLFGAFGAEYGFSRDDCSYADIACIHRLHTASAGAAEELARSVADGRARYEITSGLIMPPLLIHPGDVWQFEVGADDPNYITLRSASGPVTGVEGDLSRLDGGIVFIPSADPGYDWIFAHRIAGFVTMYGGANSHMAIRAAELNMPAVIGAGEVLFSRWSAARVIELDCANRQVRTIQ